MASMRKEAQQEAEDRFADIVGDLDFASLTYSVFMHAVGPALVTAGEMRHGNEYASKYSRCFIYKVNEFCLDYRWPLPADLLQFNTHHVEDIHEPVGHGGMHYEFAVRELAKLTDLPDPYGAAIRSIVEFYRSEYNKVSKQEKAMRKIADSLGENPSYERAASKFYHFLDAGTYGGIPLDDEFEGLVANWLASEAFWPHRRLHQRMSLIEKQDAGLDTRFWFHPLHLAGAFLIEGKWYEPDEAFSLGLALPHSPAKKDLDSVFKTAEELDMPLIKKDSSPERVEAVCNRIWGSTEWIYPEGM